MLGLHFVSSGKIPQDDSIYCGKTMVEGYIPKAEAFIGHIKGHIAIETE